MAADDKPLTARSLDVEGGSLANDDTCYLKDLGERVRRARAKRGMSRKVLAQVSGISERYLAQLEGGSGNISILLLRQVALAVGLPLEDLVCDSPSWPPQLVGIREALRRAPPDKLAAASEALATIFEGDDWPGREGRIALIGLRGAGKSTLGRRLAAKLDLPFVEINGEIERESGLSIAEIFALYGPEGYRRQEERCLRSVIERGDALVIATGGGIVSEPVTYDFLLRTCITVWLQAKPEEHMERVLAQGDRRPMANHDAAMDDLKLILESRKSLYARADLTLDTAGQSVEQSLQDLLAALAAEGYGTAG